LIRSVTNILAAAGSVAILAGGMALAGAGSASAAALPSCASGLHCQNNTAGVAGYYGADDNHTHYRYVQTEVTATPQLVNLNGQGAGGKPGQVGVELCDPNTGFAAQLSLGFINGKLEARYRVGVFFTPNSDQCVENGFTNFNFADGQPLFNTSTQNTISFGDQLTLAIYYTPGGRHFHQISFGVCDATAGVCRQAYNNSPVAVNFFEFGIGAFANNQALTAGAVNPLDTFSLDEVTCYSCKSMVPISTVAPVNPTGTGGLTETRFVNSSSQVTMSPNDSLSGSTFSIWNGSTSP
jgi:hypothetical protein